MFKLIKIICFLKYQVRIRSILKAIPLAADIGIYNKCEGNIYWI